MSSSQPYGLRFYSRALEIKPGAGATILIHHGLEKRRSDFDVIFCPLYGLLAECVFMDGMIWGGVEDEEISDALQSIHLGSCNGFTLRVGTQLEEFSRYVVDDWNGFMVFKSPYPGIERLAAASDSRLLGENRSGFLGEDSATAIFHNWDGVYWEIFAKDSSWIRPLLDAHRENPMLDMRCVDIHKDYPNPSRNAVELEVPPVTWLDD